MKMDAEKPVPYSLLASMYGAWEQYQVPAVFYHYLLAVLPQLEKKKQVLLMSRQVKTLKANTHPYHRILTAIEAREKSLDVIRNNIHILTKFQNTNQMEWPQQNNPELQDYSVVDEDQRSPLMSPRKTNKGMIVELVNHLLMYQKVTLQIIYLITQWEQGLFQLGYHQLIEFQYRKQDYLLRINIDTNELIEQYDSFFENNPFFLMKRIHEKTEYALIYAQLKPDKEMVKRIHECLNIISNHQANVMKTKMLSKISQSRTRRTIEKSTNINRIYNNYNHGRDYIMIKDTDGMKKSRITPDLTRKESKNKHEIMINPEVSPIVYHQKQKKHPVYMNLVETNLQPSSDNDVLKRSLTDQNLHRKKYSLGTKVIHGKNSIIMDMEVDGTKNRGTQLQKQFQVLQSVNNQTKFKPKAKQKPHSPKVQPITLQLPQKTQRSQLMSEQFQVEKKVQKKEKLIHKPKKEKERPVDSEEEKEKSLTELSEDNKISLTFDQNIKQTQVVKYLRNKVFQNSQVPFQEIQELAKSLLREKQFITFIRVESKRMMVAWLAVKFLQKDSMMRRSVLIVYVRKFMRLANFERKLLDVFVEHGYGLIRNEKKILYEVQMLDIVSRPLVRIKYKVNPSVQKSEIKKTMKKSKNIFQSRILKYHSYSQSTKYHKYCQHEKTYCQISYSFLEICKINVDRNSYIQAKADKITKLGDEIYRVVHNLNQTDLIVSRTLTDILQLQKQNEIEKDSSFDSKYETEFTHIAIRQGKLMRKYMNQQDQTIISEFITVNGNIPEVRSISAKKEDLHETVLLLQPPYFMAILTHDENEAKTLAVMQFE